MNKNLPVNMGIAALWERITARLRDGRVTGVFYRFVNNIIADNVFGIAAQTAFWLMMSLFPLVMVFASLMARIPLTVEAGFMDNLFPQYILDYLVPVIESTPTSATSTIIPIVLSVWSASAGIWALMRGICLSHTGRQPNFVTGRLISLVLMVGFLAMIVVSIGLWVFGEELFDWFAQFLSLGPGALYATRYLLAMVLLFSFVLLLYAAAPGYRVKKRYLAWGALFASVAWGLVNFAFEVYMNTFFRYSVLYGGVGAFLGLAIWLLAISVVILLGAELNSLIINLIGSRAMKTKRVKGDVEK